MAIPFNPSRRGLLRLLGSGLLAAATPVRAGHTLRFGTTPVILDEQAEFLRRWRDYLAERLHVPVVVVQRSKYREIQSLLIADHLDCAWLCGYPYVRNKAQLQLIAVPLYAGQPLYRSYLITPAEDQTTTSILDLRNKVFAYSDPDSNSGWLAHQVELKRHGQAPDTFFRKSFFTWSHRKVVEAVAAGLADGGAVDGYIWDTLTAQHPELTHATRVAWRSTPFGFPPLVARLGLADDLRETLRTTLLGMANDAQGALLLRHLNLDGFTAGSPKLFDSIEANWHYLHG